MKKKFFIFLLTMTMGFTSLNPVFANENNILINNSIVDEISSKYNLKDVSIEDVPEGIVPIEVSSEELENTILKIENDIKLDLNNYYTKSYESRSAGTYKQEHDVQVGVLCRAKLSTRITESNTKITNVTKPNVTLSGFSFAIDLTNVSTDSRIYNNGKNADIDANYQLDYYLVVNGLVKLFSNSVSQGFTYELDKGIVSSYLDVN